MLQACFCYTFDVGSDMSWQAAGQAAACDVWAIQCNLPYVLVWTVWTDGLR
jgi:hypothetical protein